MTAQISSDSSVDVQHYLLSRSVATSALFRIQASDVDGMGSTQKGTIMSEPNPSDLSDHAACAIAYITIVPAIVFLVLPPYNASPNVRFHAWQSIFLNLASIVLMIALSFFTVFSLIFGAFFLLLLTRLVLLALFVLWVICVVKAMNGQRFKLPLIGDLAEKQAGS
ncbi:MAG TPA: hypothetical protein VMW15_08490 [Terracidiphilus sp.]|nr:hypothetical protein [Terracidiphilus sp.]